MNARPRPLAAGSTVRAVRRDDHAAVRDVLRTAFGQYAGVVPAPLFASYLDDLSDIEGRGRDAEVLVAERDGRIVGTVSLYRDGRAAHGLGWPRSTAVVRAMAVAPRTRGLGVAQHLLEACIAGARDAGNTAIGLHTAELMLAARALYERRGFRRRAALDVFAGTAMGHRDVRGPLIIAYQLDLDGE